MEYAQGRHGTFLGFFPRSGSAMRFAWWLPKRNTASDENVSQTVAACGRKKTGCCTASVLLQQVPPAIILTILYASNLLICVHCPCEPCVSAVDLACCVADAVRGSDGWVAGPIARDNPTITPGEAAVRYPCRRRPLGSTAPASADGCRQCRGRPGTTRHGIPKRIVRPVH